MPALAQLLAHRVGDRHEVAALPSELDGAVCFVTAVGWPSVSGASAVMRSGGPVMMVTRPSEPYPNVVG
jgi:hypothetical protein